MKKFLRNKKGSDAWLVSTKTYYYIVIMLIITAALIYFMSFSSKYEQSFAYTTEYLTQDLITSRIVNVCFAYEDPNSGRVYQNILDEQKLNSNVLKECFEGDIYPSLELIITSEFSIKEKKLNLGSPKTASSYEHYALLMNSTKGLERTTLIMKK